MKILGYCQPTAFSIASFEASLIFILSIIFSDTLDMEQEIEVSRIIL